jgi:hypothetical protein
MKIIFYKSQNKGDFRLKKILLSVSVLLFSLSLYSQVTWDGGAGTTNWNDALNWKCIALAG